MKQYQAGAPIAIPAVLEGLEALGLLAGASAAAVADNTLEPFSLSQTNTLPTTGEILWNTVIKPTAVGAYDLYSQVPSAAGLEIRRFLNTASPREAIVDPMVQYRLGAGSIPVGSWKRVKDGFVRANPQDFSTEYYLDPVTVVGQRTIPISNPTVSLQTVTVNPELFKRRILRTAEEPMFTEDGVLIEGTATVPAAPNPKKPDSTDNKKSQFTRGWNKEGRPVRNKPHTGEKLSIKQEWENAGNWWQHKGDVLKYGIGRTGAFLLSPAGLGYPISGGLGILGYNWLFNDESNNDNNDNTSRTEQNKEYTDTLNFWK